MLTNGSNPCGSNSEIYLIAAARVSETRAGASPRRGTVWRCPLCRGTEALHGPAREGIRALCRSRVQAPQGGGPKAARLAAFHQGDL